MKEMDKPTGITMVYLENRGSDGNRMKINLSSAEKLKLPKRNSRNVVTIKDAVTGEEYMVRRASCGLPGCGCALKLAKPRQVKPNQ
ncbi:MAG: hypothetical protein ACRD3D_01135 [Terriglobia bacterium]